MRAFFYFVDCHLLAVSSRGGKKVRGLCGAPFIKVLIPLGELHPKASPPNAIILGVRISAYETEEGDTVSQLPSEISFSLLH